MAELDKFKRRLIRSVARLLLKEKKSPNEVWSILSEQTGRDAREIWKRMEALCLKKLSRLLAADDYVRDVGPVARMTVTDWLMFDMVLVHNQPDVCTLPKDSSTSPSSTRTAMLDLLNLAEEFNVENVPTAANAYAWTQLTSKYNENGREASPLLLQLRWYQLKTATRCSFYKFWKSFRGCARYLPTAHMPTNLHLAVVKKFPNIVLLPSTKWELLIKQGRIVLLDQLIKSKKSANRVTEEGAAAGSTTENVNGEQTETNDDQSDPDLLLLEPKIDTITVDDESDCENTGPEGDKVTTTEKDTTVNASSTTGQNNPEITMISQQNIELDKNVIENSYLSSTKNEPREEQVEIDGLINVKILDTSHIPTEEIDEFGDIEEVTSSKINERSLLAKETENATKALDDLLILDQPIKNTDIIIDDCLISTEIKNVECGNSVKETIKNSLETQDNLSGVETIENIDDLPCEKAEYKSRKESENEVELVMDEIETIETRDEFDHNIDKQEITKCYQSKDMRETKINPSEVEKATKFHPVSELPTSIELLDDGIDICEDEEDDLFVLDNNAYDDIERKTAFEEEGETLQQYVPKIAEETERAGSYVKLLMNPIVYTTKLEQMTVFKYADYENVKSDELIEAVIVESKPVSEHYFNNKLTDIKVKEEIYPTTTEQKTVQEDIIKLVPNADEDGVSNQDEVSENQRVNIASHLFKKPTYRNYNSILLCKNPDFNTRLKRLSVGFFTSERNRQLYNACKPLTVDLQKTFEMKLINGTIYLSQNESNAVNNVREQKVYINQPVSIIPSALPAQCLIDKTRSDIQQLIPTKTDAANTYEIMDTDYARADDVIDLQNEQKEREVNQELLTEEVPPIEDKIKTSSDVIEIDTVKEDNITHVPEVIDSKQIIETNMNADVDVKVEAPSTSVDLNMKSTNNTVLSLEISPLLLNIPPRTVSQSSDIHSSINTSVSDVSVKMTNTTSTVCEVPVSKTINNTIDSAVAATATVHNPIVSNVHVTTKRTKKANKQNNTITPWYAPSSNKKKEIQTPSFDDEALITLDSLFSMIEVMEGNWYEGKKKKLNINKMTKAIHSETEIKDKSETHSQEVSKNRKTEKKPRTDNDMNKPKKRFRRRKDFCCWALEKYCIHTFLFNDVKRRKKKLEPKMNHDCGLICSCCCRDILAKALRDFKLNDNDAETAVKSLDIATNTELINEPNNPIPSASDIPYEDCDEHDNQKITEVPALRCDDLNENDTQVNKNQNLVQITETRKSSQNVVRDHEYHLPFTRPNEHMESIVLSDDDDNEKIITANHLESKWTKIGKSAKQTIKPASSFLSVTPIPVNNSVMTKYTIRYKKSLMSRCPLKLGKDQVLLTSVILPPHLRVDDQDNNFSEFIGIPQNADNKLMISETLLSPQNADNRLMIPEILLPTGVSMTLQPNGLVNAVIENGVELQYDDVQKVEKVLTTVQQQINAHFGLSTVTDPPTCDVDNTIGININMNADNPTTPDLVDESLTYASTEVLNSTCPVLAPEITNQSCANVLPGSQEDNESFNVLSKSSINRNDSDQVTASDQSTVSDQVTKSDQVMTNVQASVSDQDAMSVHDTVNDQVMKNAQVNLNEQTSVSDQVAINDENIVHEQAKVVDIPNEVGGGGKKSILSDLMEMSGISSEDVQPSTEIQMPVLYPGLNKIDITNEATGNVLSQVTTVEALKYAYNQKGQFFKFDINTRSIIRIDVSIKKRKRIIMPPPLMICPPIDLTSSETNAVHNDVQTGLLSEISKLKTGDIYMLRKHIRLRNFEKPKHYGRPQARTNINREQAMFAEYLDNEEDHHEDVSVVETVTQNHKRPHEDTDSDDEPLANKVRRKENRYEETTVNTVASDNDPENYDVETLDEDFLSDASGECILGA